MKNTRGTGLSLSLKFFLMTALIVFLLIVIGLFISFRRANALAIETIRAGLNETLSTFQSFQEGRYARLKMTNKIIAQDPYFQAYLAEADPASILEQARQREADLKSDFIIVTDASGMILARTDKPAASGQSISNNVLVKQALNGDEVTGLWLEGQNLYAAVTLPIVTGDQITGVLVVGYVINETVASEIKNLTHSEIAFLLEPAGGEPVLLATTTAADKQELLSSLNEVKDKEKPFEFQMGPEKYIGVRKTLANPGGQIMGSFLAFRSLDRELVGFRQFQKSILWVGFGVMLFAFVASFLGARRITGPLRKLTNAVNEVKEQGNYEVPIEVRANDEVGVLAESFKKLLGELKEKNNLVQYLSKQATGETISGAETIVQGSEPAFPRAILSQISLGDTLSGIGAGTLIGNRYEVQSILGTGGMGLVLKARDRQLDDVVALKMLKGEAIGKDPAALERFKQELKLARRITSRYILRTYDYSEIDNYYCISMEYVKGVTLKQLILQRGILPIKIALQIAKQICSGLDAAHEKGIIHRDIKPQNVLLESTGDVKIMDFGIAAVSDVRGLTMTGTVMGTPDYMSPEQAQGANMDQRTDIYSTGVLMYEMFCGILPFVADKPLAVLHKHLNAEPPSPTGVNPQLPSELERILLKALAKQPGHRYQKISLLYADLDTLSGSLPEQS